MMMVTLMCDVLSVSYAWGSGRPGGEVTEVAKDGEVTMETKRGNEVKKKGEPENPAVYISRDEGHDVVKKASEIDIEEKKGGGSSDKEDKEDKEAEKDDKAEEKNGEPQTGDKRSAEETSEEKKDEEDKEEGKAKGKGAKKQKAEPKENGEAPKKKGRPAKGANGAAAAAPKKNKEPKKAATESGEPRRSGRNASKSS